MHPLSMTVAANRNCRFAINEWQMPAITNTARGLTDLSRGRRSCKSARFPANNAAVPEQIGSEHGEIEVRGFAAA